MVKRIQLNEKHLILIKNLRIEQFEDNNVSIITEYLGGHLLEDIAFLLGYIDKAIPNTKDDAEGRAFPNEIEEEMLALHEYIQDNLQSIEEIIHQFVFDGGVTVGTYEMNDETKMWQKIN